MESQIDRKMTEVDAKIFEHEQRRSVQQNILGKKSVEDSLNDKLLMDECSWMEDDTQI